MNSFSPALGLGNRHAQTVFGGVLRRRPPIALSREIWTVPDGDRLSVHFTETRPGQPTILVLHGLEGSAHARYVLGFLRRIAAAGWNGVAFDFRSCGHHPEDESAKSQRFYHAGKTDDLAYVVERLRANAGASPLAAVGFSLGGNVLLKWLGELGAESPLAAAVAVSVPFDLGACARAIDAGGALSWSWIYRERFMRSLRRKALGAVTAHPEKLDTAAIRACRTFADYDGRVVAPLFGFAGAEDYWARSSSKGYLAAIRRPTLLIAATDDPFVPPESIPGDVIATNPALELHLASRGGHVGFVTGSPFRPGFFAEELGTEFLAARFALNGT